MSTLPVDNPGIASVPVSSVGDVARLINSGKEQAKYARMIVFLALGGVFLDAYDLTTLSYGIDDVVREFQLSPLLTGLVTSSIMVGTIVGNIIGGWLTDKYGRYSVFMAEYVLFRDFGYRRRAGAERLGVDWRPFPDGHRRWHRPAGSDVLSGRVFPLCRQRQQSGSPRGMVPDVVRRLNRLLSHYLRPLFPAAAGAS